MNKMLSDFEGAQQRLKTEFENVLRITEKNARENYENKMTQYISDSEKKYVDLAYLDKKHQYLSTAVKDDCLDEIKHGPKDLVETTQKKLGKVTVTSQL
jgi:hypothetical protein